MRPYADTSFLASLYLLDAHTAAASAWLHDYASTAILVPTPARFELRNTLRLARFRRVLDDVGLAAAFVALRADFASGTLVRTPLPDDRLWREAFRLSRVHTVPIGSRAFDIVHVAAALALGCDTFLSFDDRQNALAQAAGLGVMQ